MITYILQIENKHLNRIKLKLVASSRFITNIKCCKSFMRETCYSNVTMDESSTKQNNTTNQDEPSPLLNGTKAAEEEDYEWV